MALAAPLADQVASGDCAAALAAVAPDTTAAAERLAAGRCALRGDDAEAALAWLEPVDGVLAGYAAWQRAEALARLGREEEARQALAHAELPPALQGQLDHTRLRLAPPTPEGVAPFLRDSPDAALRLAAAERLVAAHPDEARELLVAVWQDATPGGHDARAAELLASLGHPVPDLDSDGGRAAATRRVRSLERAYRNPEALALDTALSGGALPTTDEARLALARRRSKARDHEGALEFWPLVMGPPAEAVGSAERLFDYALTHARTGDYATAAVIYRRLVAQHPSTSQADFASFKLGYMAWDAGDCDSAVPLFDQHLERYPRTKHLDEALWFRARCHWVSGATSQAVADFERLLATRATSSLAPGAAYWIAVHTSDRDPEAGREALQSVLNRWPVSGYAWFAAERLGTRLPEQPTAEPPGLEAFGSKPAVQRAQALLQVGLDGWAEAELDTLQPTSSAHKLALAWAYLEAGAPGAAAKLACPLAPKPWKAGDPVAKQACTPKPERRLVEAVAARHGLEPAVPFGVMVAESALKPGVTSPAGARGLMQLMPEVGARLHPALFPGRPYDPDDLYIAPYNAALGTEELGQRRRSLQGSLQGTDLPAVIASYNAGEEAVRRWLEPHGEPPPFDAWAESISYTETRRYVKRVLGYAMAVRWVYGDEGGAR